MNQIAQNETRTGIRGGENGIDEQINPYGLSKTSMQTLLAVADESVHNAALCFLRRQNRDEHPEGETDNGNRFYLAHSFACCTAIRAPSREFPWSQMIHARTAVHVAHEFGIENRVSDLRRYARLMSKHPQLMQSFGANRALLAQEEARRALRKIKATGL